MTVNILYTQSQLEGQPSLEAPQLDVTPSPQTRLLLFIQMHATPLWNPLSKDKQEAFPSMAADTLQHWVQLLVP